MMSNIEITYPGVQDVLKRGAFNVARSMNPRCCADVVKNMEKLKISWRSHRWRHFWNNTKSCCLPEIGDDNTCVVSTSKDNIFISCHEARIIKCTYGSIKS